MGKIRERNQEQPRAATQPAEAAEHAAGHGNGFAQQRLEDALAGKVPGSRRGPLPHRARLEASLGADLGGVQAWFGAASALRPSGALAITDGWSIAFAEEMPDFRTVAHEAVHVVQQQQHGGGGVGVDAGGSTEREAEAAAAAAERGETVQVSRGLDSAIHRRVENPSAYDPGSTADEWTYEHRPISIEDGYSTHETGMPTDEWSESGMSVDWEVRLIATSDAPLAMRGRPRKEDLYEVVSSGSQAKGRGIRVTERLGTVRKPNISVKAQDNALYIGGGPSVDDIQQGGVGDCYFLAALTNIVAQDPERIRSTVTPAGDNVNVNFHTFDGTTWKPTTIQTDRTALHWASLDDPSIDYVGLIAAGARVGDSPVSSEWYAEVRGETLELCRRDAYEMALWAPILEKAYARLAERTDQYGGGPSRDTPNTGAHGYEKIAGGWEDQVYPIFYGNSMIGNRQERTNFVAGEDLVPLNEQAIRNLLRVGGKGVPSGEHFMLSVDLDQASAVNRLVEMIDHIETLREARKYKTLRKVLGQLRSRGQKYIDASHDGKDTGRALERLARGCARQVRPGAWPLLQDPDADKLWVDLNEHLNVVSHLGSDSSNGQRATYADHAYSVLGATFADPSGAALGLSQSNLTANLAQISGEHSRVTLRNPHHTNEPNLQSSIIDHNPEDGIFTMTLDQYLRSVSLQEIGEVQGTP